MDMSTFHLLDPETDDSNGDLQKQAQLAALQQLPSTSSPADSSSDSPASASTTTLPAAAPAVAPNVASILQGMSGQYQGAQDQVAKNQLVTNILHSFSSGLGQALGAKPDPTLWQNLTAQAQQPLTNVQNQAARLKSNLDLQKQINLQAPNKGVGSVIKTLVGGMKGADGKPLPQDQQDAVIENLSGLPLEEQLKVLPNLVKNADALARVAETHSHNLAMEDLMSQRVDNQVTNTNKKAERDQNKSYSELKKSLETFRGNKAAQQAAADVYSASKALSIVTNQDPNSLTNQDLSLLNEELAKIATGGVPGEHGVQALMPNNLQTKFAEFRNFLSSSPTPAKAGQYIQHNLSYLKDMVGSAQGVLRDYRGNIVQGYKDLIRPDQLEEVKGDYNLSDSPSGGAPSSKPPPNGLLQVQQNGHVYNWNPQSGKYE